MRLVMWSLLVMLTASVSGCVQKNAPDGTMARTRTIIVQPSGDCPAGPDPATLKINPLPVYPAPPQDSHVTPGKLIKIANPIFPICADDRGVSGIADFAFTVEPDGSVGDVKLLQEVPTGFGFAKAAEAVLPQWQYQPRVIDGKPVAHTTTYRFTMRQVDSDTFAQQQAEQKSRNPSDPLGQQCHGAIHNCVCHDEHGMSILGPDGQFRTPSTGGWQPTQCGIMVFVPDIDHPHP